METQSALNADRQPRLGVLSNFSSLAYPTDNNGAGYDSFLGRSKNLDINHLSSYPLLSPVADNRAEPVVDTTDILVANNSSSEPQEPDFISADEKFEIMVGDLRRVFTAWLKKTSLSYEEEFAKLKLAKQEFEETKERMYKNIQAEKKLELDKIKEEKRKMDAQATAQMKQMEVERDNVFKIINEKKLKIDGEIKRSLQLLDMEKQKLKKEMENFEKEKSRSFDANIATDTMVELNVGGVVFETSRSTLTRQRGSFLEGVLNGRFSVTRDRQGCIFFDKDAEAFRAILNFLRDPLLIPLPKDLTESEAIVKDAEYFGIKFFPFPLAFAIGGHNGVEHLRSVEVLDISQQLWRPCKSMQTERAYFGSASSGALLYVFAGHNLDYKALCDMEVYDAMRDTWFAGPSLNVPRRNTTGAFADRRLFAVGGYDGQDILASVEAYDRRMRHWMEVAPMLTPRSSAASCVLDDRLYVIGGTRGERLNTVECYDSRMNKWVKLPNLLEVRSSAAAAQYLNSLFVLGGTDSTHSILDSVETFNDRNESWAFGKSMPEGRIDFSAAVISGSILVGGGQNSSVLGTTDLFNILENEWQPGPALVTPRYGHSFEVLTL